MGAIDELVIEVPRAHAAEAEAIGWSLGAQGLEIRDHETIAIDRDQIQVVVYLPPDVDRAAIEATIAAAHPGAIVAWRRIEDHVAPRPACPIGARFVVMSEPGEIPEGRRAIVLPDAALTFGDGLHETTRLCVEALEAHASKRSLGRVLDVGTGTGILAIVAAHLGASTIAATDVDPLAREAARIHFEQNQVSATLSVALPDERFDLVIANLYLAPLLALSGALADRVAGHLIVSGFGHAAAPRVRAAFAAHGLATHRSTRRGAWAALDLTR
jgi:ribosomal protein L11 methyltransferase